MRIPLDKILGSLIAIGAGLSVCACAPQYPTVLKIKIATVPVGDTAGPLGEPIRQNQSLRFTWTVETHFEETRYLEWVAAGLGREGFTLHQRQENSLTLAKLDGGDAYRLYVEVTPEHPTHVQVTITVTPG